MKARGRIEVVFPDAASASAAAASMGHEKSPGGRSRVSISADGPRVAVEVEASDVVALRAAANACLRDLQVFECVESNTGKRGVGK